MKGTTRLRILARYLSSGAVDEDEFDMGRWQSCAIGEAVNHVPALDNEGLELEDCRPVYNRWDGYEALEFYFSIPLRVAERLFGPRRFTAITVGRRIERYLKQQEGP